MRQPILTSFLIFASIVCLSPKDVFGQCSQKFKVKRTTIGNSDAQMLVDIQSNNNFSISLFDVLDDTGKVYKTYDGFGSKTISMENLKKTYYKIIVEFKDENKFLCKQKVIANIKLTDKE